MGEAHERAATFHVHEAWTDSELTGAKLGEMFVPRADNGVELQSDSIGDALSEGCIRMRPADARRLYALLPAGTPVVIRSGS